MQLFLEKYGNYSNGHQTVSLWGKESKGVSEVSKIAIKGYRGGHQMSLWGKEFIILFAQVSSFAFT